LEVNFYNVDIDFNFKKSLLLKNAIKSIVHDVKKNIGIINIIFASDEYLLEINRKYLDHYYFTDVITFANSQKDYINGDIYISIDTVKSNSINYSSNNFEKELHRVIIHGVLHLIGYTDKNDVEKGIMRKKEDFYLRKISD
jgi:probable rRNA maturation factor